MLLGAAQAGGIGALVSGATAAAQGGSIADIAQAASEGFPWGAIAGGTAVMFNQAANAGSSLAGNYAVRQAVDIGTDTALDTARVVARGEDVNAKTIGRDLLTNTLMAGAKAAGGNGKNGIADKGNGGRNKPTSASQMQRQVEKGQAPKTVVRVDKAHNPNEQNQKPHVHRGIPSPSREVNKWLEKNGWKGRE